MKSMNLGSSEGHQSMGKETIIVSGASWQFVLPWIWYHVVQTIFTSYEMHQIETQSRGHFRVAVKGTY
jgi:hypothetical protein